MSDTETKSRKKVVYFGSHKWNECEQHSGKCYEDNTLGRIFESKPGTPGGDPPTYSCDKCGKVFAEPGEDPEVYRDPTETYPAFVVKPPVPGTVVYFGDGSVAGTVIAMMPERDGAPREVAISGRRIRVMFHVARLKIKVNTTVGGATFKSARTVYVICNRSTLAPLGPSGANVSP